MSALDSKILDWMFAGDTGISSETIACLLSGRTKRKSGFGHPHDPADFGQCERLLRSVPELRPLLIRMGGISPVWAEMVAHWEEIAACMEREVGISWEKAKSAPQTYELMQSIIVTAQTAV